MRAGNLRHLVTIQKLTTTRDSFGEPVESWTTFATVHAAVEPLSGREYWQAQQIAAETSLRVRIRYLAGLRPTMRIRHGRDVRAVGTITLTGLPTLAQTFVVGTRTFTWVAARTVAGEVTRGATAAACVTSIVAAIAADLATVTAADGAGDTVVVTAAAVGPDGNDIVFSESTSNMTMDGNGFLGATTVGEAVRTLEVLSVIDEDERHRELQLMCRELAR